LTGWQRLAPIRRRLSCSIAGFPSPSSTNILNHLTVLFAALAAELVPLQLVEAK
jgi:hypothetical protein